MKLLSVIAGSALLALATGPALAQQTNPSQVPLAAPAQSPLAVQSVPSGGGERMATTPEMRAARLAMRASCAADMNSLCTDASASPAPTADASQPQGGARGRMQCLRAHAAQLSVGCRQALVAMRDARKAGKS